MTEITDRGPTTSRRTLVRGAAWSVPVVSMATVAPAYAASYCPNVTVDWASLGVGSVFTSTTVGNVRVVLSATGATGAANNMTISGNPTGGQSSSLRFYSGSADNSSQTVTFQFFYRDTSDPVNVRNLSFSFLDIDSNSNPDGQWFDRVRVNTGGYGVQIYNSNYVQGAGTNNNRFRPTGTNTAAGSLGTSPNGNVKVDWAAALTSVQFIYSQGLAANGSPFIGISNMSFDPELC